MCAHCVCTHTYSHICIYTYVYAFMPTICFMSGSRANTIREHVPYTAHARRANTTREWGTPYIELLPGTC